MRNALLSVAGAAAAAFAALPAEALTTNVSSVAELVAAINSSDVPGGSVVVLAAGTYDLSEVEPVDPPDSNGKCSIVINNKKLILKGADTTSWRDSPTRTTGAILKGVSAARIIYGYGGSGRSSEFHHITFDGGCAPSGKNGGAILFNGCEQNGFATNCVFRNCSGTDGGATRDVTAYDCLYEDNSATRHGGGAYGGRTAAGGKDRTNEFVRCEFLRNKATSNGGAVYCNVVGIIGDSLFMTNSASTDGALYYYNSARASIVSASLFFGNTSTSSEGGACRYVDAVDCVFVGNGAQNHRGGAMHKGSALRCAFTNNTCLADSRGGACAGTDCTECIFSGRGDVSCGAFDRCTFDGVFEKCVFDCLANNGGPVCLTNCLVTNCRARRLVNNDGNRGEFVNCTFADNIFGISGDDWTSYDSTAYTVYCNSGTNAFVNCIFSGNRRKHQSSDTYYDSDLRLYRKDGNCSIQFANCLFTKAESESDYNWAEGAGTLVNGDPLFVAGDAKYPGLPHYSILRKSPARNAGANADWMLSATDFAGNARIFDDVVDIGCYECILAMPGMSIIVR